MTRRFDRSAASSPSQHVLVGEVRMPYASPLSPMKRKPIPEIEQLSGESVQLYGVLYNESDLGCVLIACSYLDYTLASLLKRYFVESTLVNKLLDPPGGAVSTFAARSDLVYCLGL